MAHQKAKINAFKVEKGVSFQVMCVALGFIFIDKILQGYPMNFAIRFPNLLSVTAKNLVQPSSRRQFVTGGIKLAVFGTLYTQLGGCARFSDEEKAFIAREHTLETRAVGLNPTATAKENDEDYSIDVYAALDKNNRVMMRDGNELLQGIMFPPITQGSTVLPRMKMVFDKPYTEDELPNLQMAVDWDCVRKKAEEARMKEEEAKKEKEIAAKAKKDGNLNTTKKKEKKK
ncbi:MAG TPA: hypothetical protein DCY07_06320, partial [Rhodospirillaceae bacterium]|nr:hypothetical protein [Rhodospirillaceae bacterium]